jgi:hypothetical protein
MIRIIIFYRLFGLLGKNLYFSSSIPSKLDLDIGSADPLASMRRASMRAFFHTLRAPDYVPATERQLRFFVCQFHGIVCRLVLSIAPASYAVHFLPLIC